MPSAPAPPSTPPQPPRPTPSLYLLSHDDSRLLDLAFLAFACRSFVPIASGRQLLQTPTYIIHAQLGSPPQSLLLAINTSSDMAAWLPCSECPSSAAVRPIALLACSFTYGSSSLLTGLAQDSLSLAYDVIAGYTFNCVQKAAGPSALPQGLLGLGRIPLFFLSQTKNLYSSTFFYCLPSFKSLNFSGTL